MASLDDCEWTLPTTESGMTRSMGAQSIAVNIVQTNAILSNILPALTGSQRITELASYSEIYPFWGEKMDK